MNKSCFVLALVVLLFAGLASAQTVTNGDVEGAAWGTFTPNIAGFGAVPMTTSSQVPNPAGSGQCMQLQTNRVIPAPGNNWCGASTTVTGLQVGDVLGNIECDIYIPSATAPPELRVYFVIDCDDSGAVNANGGAPSAADEWNLLPGTHDASAESLPRDQWVTIRSADVQRRDITATDGVNEIAVQVLSWGTGPAHPPGDIVCIDNLRLAPPQSIPETSADGAITIDGDTSEAAWANALTLTTAWGEDSGTLRIPPSGGTAIVARGGPATGAADFTGTVKLMRQDQKFYIAGVVTDQQPTGTYSFFGPMFPAAQRPPFYRNVEFEWDAMEIFFDLSGAPGTGPPGAGDISSSSQIACRADKLYNAANNPQPGSANREWLIDVKGDRTVPFSDPAFSVDFVTGASSITYEFEIDADQIPGLSLVGGRSISFAASFKDMDSNNNFPAPPLRIEPPLNGDGGFLNRNSFMTGGLLNSSAPWIDVSV